MAVCELPPLEPPELDPPVVVPPEPEPAGAEPDPELPELEPPGGEPELVGPEAALLVAGELFEVPPHAAMQMTINAAQMAGKICPFIRPLKNRASVVYSDAYRCCTSVLRR